MDGKLAALEDLKEEHRLDKLVLAFVLGWLQQLTQV